MTSDAVKTLFHPFESGALPPHAAGERVLFMGAEPGFRRPEGFAADIACVQGFRPAYLALARAGETVHPAAVGQDYDAILVLVGRHRGRNELYIAEALERSRPGATVVVAGGKDDSQHWTTMGPDWHADPYHLAPRPKTLLTVFNGEHLLGGIQGHDNVETTDESPDRVAAVAELTAAYLRTAFDSDDTAWQTAQDALATGPDAFGQVASR